MRTEHGFGDSQQGLYAHGYLHPRRLVKVGTNKWRPENSMIYMAGEKYLYQ